MVIAVEGPDAIAASDAPRSWDIRRVETTASTNADVMALARDGAPEGIVVVADHQSAGRGRAGRTWTAPPGSSLMCTLLLRPPPAVAGLVTLALAVAAAEAVDRVAGFAPGVKWPNDLVVERADGTTRKLAGILAEAEWPAGATASAGPGTAGPGERATLAVGIGLNVTWPAELPEELAGIATAINHVTDRPVTRDAVLDALLGAFAPHYDALVAGRVDAVLDAWRARSTTLGRRVRVDLGSREVVGSAVDIDGDGHLLVDEDSGERRTLAVGDVVHLRPLD